MISTHIRNLKTKSPLSHELGSERMSAVERASEASRGDPANEWAVRMIEWLSTLPASTPLSLDSLSGGGVGAAAVAASGWWSADIPYKVAQRYRRRCAWTQSCVSCFGLKTQWFHPPSPVCCYCRRHCYYPAKSRSRIAHGCDAERRGSDPFPVVKRRHSGTTLGA